MATFSLTARLKLSGPDNLAQIATKINNGLNLKSHKIHVSIDKGSFDQVKAAMQGVNGEIKRVDSSLSALKKNFSSNTNTAQFSSSLNQVSQAAKKVQRDVKGAKDGVSDFTREALIVAKRSAAFALTTSALFGTIRLFSYGVSEAIAFEKEMVKIGQVSDKSLKSLRGLSDEIGRIATEYGTSSKELADVAQTLIQAGIPLKDTQRTLETIAKSSLAPSFNDTKNTVEALIAIMGQFKNVNNTSINTGDFEKVLGSINKLSADLAVEADDITAAVRRAGSVFASIPDHADTAIESLNKFNAIFSVVRQNTRESAETIATGLRTIFTRIQRPRTIEFLRQYGVELQNAKGNFVGAYEALKRLSVVFNSLPSNSGRAAEIAEEVAGIRQIAKFLPAVTDQKSIEAAYQKALSGSDSLNEQKIAAQKSLANQIDKTRESFLKLSRDIYNSDSFKALATSILFATNAVIRLLDSMKELLPLVLTFAAIKAVPSIFSVAQGARGFFNPAKRNGGGQVLGFNRGGLVPGQGNGDTVPAMLEAGEYVIRKDAVKAIGINNLERANYAKGGRVDRQKRLGFLPDMFNFYGRIFGGDVATAMRGIKKPRFYQNMKSQTSGNDIFGRYRPETQQIGILAGLEDRDTKSTIAHEYFHAYTDTFKDLALMKTMSAFGSKNPMMKITDEAKRHADFKGFDGKMREYFLEPQEIAARSFEQLAYPHYKHMTVPKRERYDEMNKLMMAARHERKMYMENDEDPERQFLNMIFGGKKFARGGSSKDRIPAMLTPGEYIINQKAASRIGKARLDKWNKADKLGGQVLGFNKGGQVPGSPIRMSEGGSLDIITLIKGDLKYIAKQFGLDIVKELNVHADSFSNPKDKYLQENVRSGRISQNFIGAYDPRNNFNYFNTDEKYDALRDKKLNITKDPSVRRDLVGHEIFHNISRLYANKNNEGEVFDKILAELKIIANQEIDNAIKTRPQRKSDFEGHREYYTSNKEVAARAFGAAVIGKGDMSIAVKMLQALGIKPIIKQPQNPEDAKREAEKHRIDRQTKPKVKVENVQKPIQIIRSGDLHDRPFTQKEYIENIIRTERAAADLRATKSPRKGSFSEYLKQNPLTEGRPATLTNTGGNLDRRKSYFNDFIAKGYSSKEANSAAIAKVIAENREYKKEQDEISAHLKRASDIEKSKQPKGSLAYRTGKFVGGIRNRFSGFFGSGGGGGNPPNNPPFSPEEANNKQILRNERLQNALYAATALGGLAAYQGESIRQNATNADRAGLGGGISGAGAGLLAGVNAGAMFGPWGALAGAIGGVTIGAIDGMNSAIHEFNEQAALKSMTGYIEEANKSLEKYSKANLSAADRAAIEKEFYINLKASKDQAERAGAEGLKKNNTILNYLGTKAGRDYLNSGSIQDIIPAGGDLSRFFGIRVEDYFPKGYSGLFGTSEQQEKARKEAAALDAIKNDVKLTEPVLAQQAESIDKAKIKSITDFNILQKNKAGGALSKYEIEQYFEAYFKDFDFLGKVNNVKEVLDTRVAKRLEKEPKENEGKIIEEEKAAIRKESREKFKNTFIGESYTDSFSDFLIDSAKNVRLLSLQLKDMQSSLTLASEAISVQKNKLQDYTNALSGNFSAGKFESLSIGNKTTEPEISNIFRELSGRTGVDLTAQKNTAIDVQKFGANIQSVIEKYSTLPDTKNEEKLRETLIGELSSSYKNIPEVVITELANEIFKARKDGGKDFESIPGSLGTFNELKETIAKFINFEEDAINKRREVYNQRIDIERNANARIYELSRISERFEQERLEKTGRLFGKIPDSILKDSKLASITGGETDIDRIGREAIAKRNRLELIKNDPNKEREALILSGDLNKLNAALEHVATSSDRLGEINNRLAKIEELKDKQRASNDKFLGGGLSGRINQIRNVGLLGQFFSSDDKGKNRLLSSGDIFSRLKDAIESIKLTRGKEESKKVEDRFLAEVTRFSPEVAGLAEAMKEEGKLKELEAGAKEAQVTAAKYLGELVTLTKNDGVARSNQLLGQILATLKTRAEEPFIKKANGGQIVGNGGSRTDSIPAMLSNGEFVVNANATKRIGAKNLDFMNRNGKIPGFADGGEVTKNKGQKLFDSVVQRMQDDFIVGKKNNPEKAKIFANLLKELEDVKNNKISITKISPYLQRLTNEEMTKTAPKEESIKEYAARLEKITGRPNDYSSSTGREYKGVGSLENRSFLVKNQTIADKRKAESDARKKAFYEKYPQYKEAAEKREIYKNINFHRNVHAPGGALNKMASGGIVSGPGSAVSDSIPIMASAGEFIIKAARAKEIGYKNLEQMNSGVSRFANGGIVSKNINNASVGRTGPNPIEIDMSKFITSLDTFKKEMTNIADRLDGLTITMEGKHEVNVVINGAEVLNELLNGPLSKLVSQEIQKAMKVIPLEQKQGN